MTWLIVGLFLTILFADPWGFLSLYYAIPVISLTVKSKWNKFRALKKFNK